MIHGQVGTGPYRVLKNEPSEIILERFEKYHGGLPQIRTVSLRTSPTLRTAWTSLLRGDIDMVSNVTPEAVEFISNDDIQVVSYVRHFQFVVAFSSQATQLRSPEVRRALNLAVDRDSLIRNVLHGRGLPSTGPLWPRHWAIDPAITSYRYDSSLAVSLLQGAHLPQQSESKVPGALFRFVCLVPANFAVLERVALEVQKQLFNARIDMQFEVVPIEEFNNRVRDGKFEAMLMDVVSGPTFERGYQFWRSRQHFQGFNTFGYENPESDRVIDILRQTSNEAAVRSANSRLQQIWRDDPPALFLAWSERTRAVSKAFTIVQESGRDPVDPLYTIWRWTADRRMTLARAN